MADLLCYMALLVTPPGLDHRELQATRPATPMGKPKLNRTDSKRCHRQGLHEAPHADSLSRGWEEERSERKAQRPPSHEPCSSPSRGGTCSRRVCCDRPSSTWFRQFCIILLKIIGLNLCKEILLFLVCFCGPNQDGDFKEP